MQNPAPQPTTKTCLPVPVGAARHYRQMDLRRRILQALRNEPCYIANEKCLLFAVREQGHAISRDQLIVELAWLDQIAQALICSWWGSLCVANLTDKGLAVAEGTLSLPGIATSAG